MIKKIYITPVVLLFCACVHAQVSSKLDSVKSNAVHLATSVTLGNVNNVKTEIQKKIVDSFLAAKQMILSPVLSVVKRPFTLERAEVFYNGSYDNNFLGSNSYLNNGIGSFSAGLFGIPVQVDARFSNWIGYSTSNFSFQFDRAGYIHQLERDIKSKVDGKKILSSISDPLFDLKRSAEQTLTSELNQINSQYQNLLTSEVVQVGNFDQLVLSDITTIRNVVMETETIKNLSALQSEFEQLKSRKDLGETIDTAQLRMLTDNIRKAEGLSKIVAAVERHKKSWESSGLLTRFKQWEGIKQIGFQKALSDPSTVISLARQQLNLNSLQRLFLNVNKFNLGQNALSSSALSFQNFLNSGVASEIVNKSKSAMLLIGKTREGSAISDMPFSNTLFSNAAAKALQLGKVNSTGDFHISIASFQEGMNTVGNLSGLNRFRQSFVTTLNKGFSFGKYGYLTTEISRSISSNGVKSSSDDARGLQKLLSADDFSSNTAFNIGYRDEYPGIGLTYQVHVKKAALGYDNPGNPFLNTGSEEAGLSVRKSFFEKRMTVMLRNTTRQFNYGEGVGSKWRNNYSVFDVKWKLNRASYLSVRYLPNRMFRYDDLGKHPATTLDYLSFDGNFNKRISKTYYTNYSSLLFQSNQFASGLTSYTAKNIGLVINQSLSIKEQIYYWNTQLNRSANNSQLVYLNSSFNSELGTSFNLLRLFSLSSSISYNSVDQWYRQIGVRETLDVQVKQRFMISGFIDVRKNLELYQPLIFGLVRGSVQLHYNFK